MTLTRALVSNALWTWGSRIASPLLGYAAFLIIANRLGEDAVGRYGFITSVLGLALLATHQGIDGFLLREVAQRPDEVLELAADAHALKVVLALVAGAVAMLAAAALGCDREVLIALAVGAVGLLVQSVDVVPRQLLGAREQMRALALSQLAERVVYLGVVWALLPAWGLPGIAGALLAGGAVRHVANLATARPLDYLGVRPRADRMWRMGLDSLTLALVEVFLTLYFRIDVLMLSLIAGDVPTGRYVAAYRILDAAMALPLGILVVAYPRLARTAAQQGTAFVDEVRWFLDLLTRMALPAGVGLYMVAAPLTRLFYGTRFAGVEAIVEVLAAALTLLFSTYFLGYVLTASHRQASYVKVMAATTLFNVVVNLALIPTHGGLGAAWATLLSEIVAILLLARELSGILREVLRPAALVSTLVGTALMGLALHGAAGWHVTAQITLGAGVYALWSSLANSLGKRLPASANDGS